MPKLKILSADDRTVAWADTWIVDEVRGQRLVAIPLLCLDYDVATCICAGSTYEQVFRACVLELGDETHPFSFVFSHYHIWATGEPDLVDTALVLKDGPLSLEERALYIPHGTRMLRGEAKSA